MGDQTDSSVAGSTARARGPALAVLATAPRPGLALTAACPPLTPAEAGALQTAWLKGIAQEVAGVAVHLCGRPSDALPMLRYFAGPGVELVEWQLAAGAEPDAPRTFAAAAHALFARGHGPVLVRVADAPEPTTADVLACLATARAGRPVWAPDQRGRAWLVGLPDAAAADTLPALADAPAAFAAGWCRGPWARRVVDGADVHALLAERSGGALPTLAVPDETESSAWFRRVFGAHAAGASVDPDVARPLRFVAQRDPRPNGCRIAVSDPDRWHALAAAAGVVRRGDELARGVDDGSAFTATDPHGNRLTFGTVPSPA